MADRPLAAKAMADGTCTPGSSASWQAGGDADPRCLPQIQSDRRWIPALTAPSAVGLNLWEVAPLGSSSAKVMADGTCTPGRSAKFVGRGGGARGFRPLGEATGGDRRSATSPWSMGGGSADRRSFDRRLPSGTPPASGHRTGFG